MTAVIHHGPPGSYKTFALVQRVLIPALVQGRVIITNIRGFNDIDRIRKTLDIVIPPSAAIYYIEPDKEGFDVIARFFHWAPAGALIAMDEGQRVYPTRDKGFKHLDLASHEFICDIENKPLIDNETNQPIARPRTLENAFDQHRHFNWDIYISTPNISKIHSEIRGVVEWAYRHRNMSGLLPWMRDTWMEFRHDAESSGKSVSNYSGTPKKYKADSAIFDCYQSTATGAAKDSNENISVFRDPKLRLVLFVLIFALALVFYNGIQAYKRITKEQPAVIPTPVLQNSSLPDHSVPARSASASSVPYVVPVSPLATAQIFYVGDASMPLFEVKFPDNRVISMSYLDLRILGYSIEARGQSFIILSFAGQSVYAWTKPASQLQATTEAMRGGVLTGMPVATQF